MTKAKKVDHPAADVSVDNDDDLISELRAFLATQKSTGKQKGIPVKKVRLYCWTHGSIGHASGGKVKPCNNSGLGHKFEATFENQMDGKSVK